MDRTTTDRSAVTVNGLSRPLDGTDPATNLLDFLRGLGLTGAKEGCAEGECGACAVLVLRPDGPGRSRWTAVNACLLPAASLDGQEVLTVEGLGTSTSLHPVQRALAEGGGSQCGYCTPGFVCAMAAEYYRPGRGDTGADGFDLHALSGNLCRCTGYRPIEDAALGLARPHAGDPLADRASRAAPGPSATRLAGPSGRFERPRDLSHLLALLDANPGAVLVAGSTDRGVDVNLRGVRSPLVVAVDRVPELRRLTVTDASVEVGAALTLTEVGHGLAGRVPLLDELLPQFASPLIRNSATLGGNLATASPVGDAAPALLALDAVLVLASSAGDRELPVAGFFTGYRRTGLRPGEVIRAVRIPLPLSEITAFFKIAKRRFDDISSVAAAFALSLDDAGTVRRARVGLGGVAATPLRASATERALEGRPWNAETVREAAGILAREGTPIDDHRASAAYRGAMLGTALTRLLARTQTLEEARS